MSPVTRGVLAGAIAFVVATVLLGVIAAGLGGDAVVSEDSQGAGQAILLYVLTFFAAAAGGAIGAWQARQAGAPEQPALRGGMAGPAVVGLLLSTAGLSADAVGAALGLVTVVLGSFTGARAAASRPTRDELA